MKTTLNAIRSHQPCAEGWKKLMNRLGKTQADDEPLSILTILDSNGLVDALWCLRAVEGHDRDIRLLAVRYARRVEHLMLDPRSRAALDVAERHALGQATDAELGAAAAAVAEEAETARRAAAWAAAWAAEAEAAAAAAAAAAWAADAAAAAAEAAEWAAAKTNERRWQESELRRVCAEVEARDH